MDTSMQNYVQKVIEMRTAQKEYFRTRDQHHLLTAKRLEAHVDQLSKQLQSPTLFDHE
jgi:hypothetical protein